MLERFGVYVCASYRADTVSFPLNLVKKKNQSHYRPEVPRGLKEVDDSRLRDNDPGWW